jgi:alanine racemase
MRDGSGTGAAERANGGGAAGAADRRVTARPADRHVAAWAASDPAARAGAVLHVDLDAAVANYRRLAAELGSGTECGVVVKADAYGLGVTQLAPAFAAAGARRFFVATIDEALALRALLDAEEVPEARIAVLNGVYAGTEADLVAARITPVVNSLQELALWTAAAARAERHLPAILHVDTGMSRLGLPDDEIALLGDAPERLRGVHLEAIMSHLACADTPSHPENAAQLARFRDALGRLPAAPASLANSSGVFLGPAFHHDVARPGVALYGVNPTPGHASPMQPVVRLRARVLQVRQIDAHRGVGYGATFRASGPTRIATVAAGYADGCLRALSNSGHVATAGQLLPIAGRVSMDSITVDATALPADGLAPGDWVDLIGPGHDIDALAREAGTSGYEMLTALGHRYHRVYRGGAV